MTAAENPYIEMVDRLVALELRDAPDQIVVACMVMVPRSEMGEQPPAVYDRELNAALRALRQRATLERPHSDWKN